ncbi:hypothetical protein HU200_002511 [Digitaria exilis]|uniref:Uncharacterized protein n=1 Tax=Digitaria exilis TaxID=1010633 RepID=A0A835KTX1_9POAL|nr:hypothetical protein HU200_002511 [Digitaria exilis]
MALNKSVIVVFLVVAFIQSISLCSFTCVGSAWPTPKPKPENPCYHAGSSPHPCTTQGCSRMCQHYHHNGAMAYCKSISPGECCCPS